MVDPSAPDPSARRGTLVALIVVVALLLASAAGVVVDRGRVEGAVGGAAEDQARGPGARQAPLGERGAERLRDRHGPRARPGLGQQRAFDVVPRAADVQDAAREVDVLPEQRAELAHAQPGVHSRGPERAVLVEGREERWRLLARGDAVAAAADGGELEAERRG